MKTPKARAAEAPLHARLQELEQSLQRLANEAHGFLSMSRRTDHGNTNMSILLQRISEARALLAPAGDGGREL